ncbi:MAG: 50S ribosomal protein L21 [Planctomycetaceae bacterium]|jgi:large subunit ribosomal protein L21|nr:50S ribosomal protein L21 [Planctomycetaceae bacterium]
MYAIFEDGGRQFKVQESQEILVDFNEGWKPNTEIAFESVLLIGGDNGTKIGQPYIQGAKVTALVVGTALGEKLTIRWFRRRKNSKKKVGHRQKYTKIKIKTIDV